MTTTARFVDPDHLRVEVNDGDAIRSFPAVPACPLWLELKRQVDAGEIEIEPYQPPESEE